MSFPNIPRQLQEEIIFPRELKWFRYEEVTSLNVVRKQKICDFEKSDIVGFSENLATSTERHLWNLANWDWLESWNFVFTCTIKDTFKTYNIFPGTIIFLITASYIEPNIQLKIQYSVLF